MKSLLNLALCPAGRLDPAFPWTPEKAAGHYFGSLVRFFFGTFLFQGLFLAVVGVLIYYPDVYFSFVTTADTIKVLVITGLIGAGLTWLAAWLMARFYKRRLSVTTTTLYSIVGALALIDIVVVGCLALLPYYYDILTGLLRVMATPDGKPRLTFLMAMATICFVCGFGLQLRYIHRCLKADGLSLTGIMALNIDARRGKSRLATVWNVLWPVGLGYVIIYALANLVIAVLGAPHQATVELARSATGGNFLAFALMAVIGAPLFEEVIFRGFLFQIIRSSLRNDHSQLVQKLAPTEGRFLWLRQWTIRLGNLVRRVCHPVSSVVLKFLGRSPDLFGVVLSSAIFSLVHFQFHPSTLVLLFVLGCVHAELYRRTGSLWCSILLHGLNNCIDVVKIGLGG